MCSFPFSFLLELSICSNCFPIMEVTEAGKHFSITIFYAFFPYKNREEQVAFKYLFIGHFHGFLLQYLSPQNYISKSPSIQRSGKNFIANPQISTTYILPLTFYYTWFIGYLSTHRSSILWSGAFQSCRFLYLSACTGVVHMCTHQLACAYHLLVSSICLQLFLWRGTYKS